MAMPQVEPIMETDMETTLVEETKRIVEAIVGPGRHDVDSIKNAWDAAKTLGVLEDFARSYAMQNHASDGLEQYLEDHYLR